MESSRTRLLRRRSGGRERRRGFSNRRAARALHLSEATVKRHLANVYPKMGVRSRGEATRKALSEGWITVRDIEGGG